MNHHAGGTLPQMQVEFREIYEQNFFFSFKARYNQFCPTLVGECERVILHTSLLIIPHCKEDDKTCPLGNISDQETIKNKKEKDDNSVIISKDSEPHT